MYFLALPFEMLENRHGIFEENGVNKNRMVYGGG
jgi:hypothetical protein